MNATNIDAAVRISSTIRSLPNSSTNSLRVAKA